MTENNVNSIKIKARVFNFKYPCLLKRGNMGILLDIYENLRGTTSKEKGKENRKYDFKEEFSGSRREDKKKFKSKHESNEKEHTIRDDEAR